MENIFKERLAELRNEKKLNQMQLAKETNLSQAAISRWENGERIPDIFSIIAFVEFFGVSADYLLGLENEDGTKNY